MEQTLRRNIKVIPKKPIVALTPQGFVQRKRVSAYCRVSTKYEQQLDSLENQTTHYTEYIQKHPDWEFAGIYADPGLSGTMLKKRDEFNKMVVDAKAGKFDLVLIKSISRYCRNTVDSLKTARELAACGVVIYFEKENLYSNDPKTEMAFTMLSSFAQEESRSISENVARGKRMKAMSGTAKLISAYGYARDGEGGLLVVREAAEIVKRIFEDFLDGQSTQQIALQLNAEGIPSPTNKTWRSSAIQCMLQNEKYMGDTHFQKVYIENFMNHKTVKNNGELESYYWEDTHEPIIDKKDFALVQTEIKRRNEMRGKSESGWTKYSGKYAFSNLLRCAKCGARYRRHAYAVKGDSKHEIKHIRTWVCQTKNNKERICEVNFSIPETELEQAFTIAVKELIQDESVLNDLMINVTEALDTVKVSDQLTKLDEELNLHRVRMCELMQLQMSSLQARKVIDDEIQSIMQKSESIQVERNRIISNMERSNLDQKRLDELQGFIKDNNPLDRFDKDLFRKLIRYAVVHSRDEVEFIFFTGVSKRARLESGKRNKNNALKSRHSGYAEDMRTGQLKAQ